MIRFYCFIKNCDKKVIQKMVEEKKFTQEGHLIKDKKKSGDSCCNVADTGSQSAVPNELVRISENVWELPASYKKGMRVPARIVASEELIQSMDKGVFEQVTNVASLPGIQKYAYCMPDGHI